MIYKLSGIMHHIWFFFLRSQRSIVKGIKMLPYNENFPHMLSTPDSSVPSVWERLILNVVFVDNRLQHYVQNDQFFHKLNKHNVRLNHLIKFEIILMPKRSAKFPFLQKMFSILSRTNKNGSLGWLKTGQLHLVGHILEFLG